MKLENQNILIVSNESWGTTWYSKHNYAWELSKKNNVFFVNGPSPFKLANWFTKNISEEKIHETLTVINYKNVLPVKFEFLRLLNELVIFKLLKRYLKLKGVSNIIFWTFDLYRLTTPKKLDPQITILHSVDKYTFTKKAETVIAKNADIVFCVAEEIAESYKGLNSNIHIIPHAIPSDEFLEVKYTREKQLTGIYVGNIDKRMDFEFTRYIIKKFPQITFDFVGEIVNDGSNSDLVFSGDLPNAVFHGEKPYKDLKNHIRNADFCFVFKDPLLNGNNISSHKMLQYFAQGKPIFCTFLSKYIDVSDLLYMENSKEVMAQLIQKMIVSKESETLIQQRIEYAKQHSFENTFKKIEKILSHG